MMSLLSVEKINTFYDVFHAIFDVSLALDPVQVVCLLGRNGAGKTTTLNSIVGLNPPRSGRVVYRDTEITTASRGWVSATFPRRDGSFLT